MSAFDRCIEKIDKAQASFCEKCDLICADLMAVRRYNQNTMLIWVALIWGMVPVVLVCSILFAAWF